MPVGRVPGRQVRGPQLPRLAPPGGAIADGAAPIAAVEGIEGGHQPLHGGRVGRLEERALHPAGRRQRRKNDARLRVAEPLAP